MRRTFWREFQCWMCSKIRCPDDNMVSRHGPLNPLTIDVWVDGEKWHWSTTSLAINKCSIDWDMFIQDADYCRKSKYCPIFLSRASAFYVFRYVLVTSFIQVSMIFHLQTSIPSFRILQWLFLFPRQVTWFFCRLVSASVGGECSQTNSFVKISALLLLLLCITITPNRLFHDQVWQVCKCGRSENNCVSNHRPVKPNGEMKAAWWFALKIPLGKILEKMRIQRVDFEHKILRKSKGESIFWDFWLKCFLTLKYLTIICHNPKKVTANVNIDYFFTNQSIIDF